MMLIVPKSSMPHVPIRDLRDFGEESGVEPLKEQGEIFRAAIEKVKTKHRNFDQRILKDFDSLIQEIELTAKGLYFKEENRYVCDLLNAFLETGSDTKRLLLDNERLIAKLYLSLIQGRKNRAGKTLEKILILLFDALGYPHADQVRIADGKPDFIMPSVEYYERNPLNCIIFTSKRKLRERWRQIVTEGMRGTGFFLGTIDEDISETELRQMLQNRIFVVCPRDIKQKCYPSVDNVLSYEQFFQQHLAPKMTIWKQEGIV